MADAVSIRFDAKDAFAGLDAYAVEIKAETRPAAQAAAQVFYEETKLRAPVAKRTRKSKSGRTIKPGALRDSIYQVFSADNSDATRATYHVSWNAKKAPHGHLVEFGTSKAPAHPFLRPAFDTALQPAMNAANARLQERFK